MKNVLSGRNGLWGGQSVFKSSFPPPHAIGGWSGLLNSEYLAGERGGGGWWGWVKPYRLQGKGP
ncbi:MAG: hypothetical protein LIP16_14345, partial [Clostridium sp.]|nr:hypothetical protein [Clostridium sp.]